MKIVSRLLLVMLVVTGALSVAWNISFAVDQPLEFKDQDRQFRYQKLLEELRCLVCQNQSLAESNADLAQDLREEIYNMIRDGKDNKAILEFLVARYGDFVLYKPPLKKSTWLLWFGPFLLFIIAALVVYVFPKTNPTRPGLSLPHHAYEPNK